MAHIEPHTAPKPRAKPYGLDEWKRKQAVLENYEALRDDVISAVRNSGMSYELIHERCGPHPTTLTAWELKRVGKPRLEKLISTLRIIGLTLVVEPLK
jgi:hypothetical protein